MTTKRLSNLQLDIIEDAVERFLPNLNEYEQKAGLALLEKLKKAQSAVVKWPTTLEEAKAKEIKKA